MSQHDNDASRHTTEDLMPQVDFAQQQLHWRRSLSLHVVHTPTLRPRLGGADQRPSVSPMYLNAASYLEETQLPYLYTRSCNPTFHMEYKETIQQTAILSTVSATLLQPRNPKKIGQVY